MLGCLLPSTYLAYTDATKRNLYDYVTIPIFIAGLAYAIYAGTWLNSLLTASAVFFLFLALALVGGLGGGDTKFATAVAVWFGFPLTVYVILLGSVLGFVYGVFNLARLGLLKKRLVPFFQGIYHRIVYGTDLISMPKLPENDEISEEAIPYGTFIAIAAWIVFIIIQFIG